MAPPPRFSLRSAFIATAVLAVALWSGITTYRGWRQQRVVRESSYRLATPSSITDADLRTLTEYFRAGQYKSLNLTGSQITDEGVELLAQLDSLEEITLDSTAFSGSGLIALRTLPNLRKLSLLDSKASWKNVVQLTVERPQVAVTLSREKYGPSARIVDGFIDVPYLWSPSSLLFTGLDQATEIRGFRVHDRWFTDGDLAQLRGAALIKTLDLEGTRITDAGINTILGMKQLENLTYPRSISAMGEQRLTVGLPNCSLRREPLPRRR